MKFNGGAPPTAQSSASNGGPKVVPKMKLTGCGKMPVVDMRGPEHNVPQPTNSETVQLQVTAPQPNATSSPVYAVVNKANKRKLKTESSGAPTPQPFPNYCNVEVGLTGKPPICPPREPYYENSRQVVSRMKQV